MEQLLEVEEEELENEKREENEKKENGAVQPEDEEKKKRNKEQRRLRAMAEQSERFQQKSSAILDASLLAHLNKYLFLSFFIINIYIYIINEV